jgi:hypothetical protein
MSWEAPIDVPLTICTECEKWLALGDWPFCPHGSVVAHNSQVSNAEAVILYEHPTKGIRWPGRNDAPMPKAYAREGFQRVEYKGGIADVRRIERRHGVVSEIGNFDHGSGRADRD